MKILLLPNEPPINSDSFISEFKVTSNSSLNGYFYDYFRGSSDIVLGIRYWLDEASLGKNSIFSRFSNDERFSIHEKEFCVDIVFDKEHVRELACNDLKLDSVQDFGGIEVVQLEENIGILLSL